MIFNGSIPRHDRLRYLDTVDSGAGDTTGIACAFPAGTYVSLRVCIGEAEGQNWWCCLFPPLCLSAATAKSDNEDAFIQVGLTKDQYGIITETGKTKYKVRFKLLEVLEDWFG